ncbi:MAG: thrombospondin type 3 repeat-containing protein, partial [Candidatus Poseidoniales archaeon]
GGNNTGNNTGGNNSGGNNFWGNNTGNNTGGNNTGNVSEPCSNPSILTFNNTSSAYAINQSIAFTLSIECGAGDEPFVIQVSDPMWYDASWMHRGNDTDFVVDWGTPGICDYCWTYVHNGESFDFWNNAPYELTLTLVGPLLEVQGNYSFNAVLTFSNNQSLSETWNFTVYEDNDSDGISDATDNCPMVANANQMDNDGDGLGDACDLDIDGDGVDNQNDALPFNGNETIDTDNDGLGDNADTDDDGDGMADSNDAFPLNPTEQSDLDGDGVGDNLDADDDGDGISDANDNCPLIANADQADLDGDGVGTACDGMELTVSENGTIEENGNAIPSIGMVGTVVVISAGFFIAIRREDEEEYEE